MIEVAIVFNFVVVLGILFHFGRKPTMAFLAQRSQNIATQMREATEMSAGAQRELAEWQKRWSDSEAIAKQQFDDAKKSLERFKEQVLAHAKAESSRIQHEAKLVGETEGVKAQERLRTELVHTSVRVARDYLSSHVEDKDKSHLVTEYLETVRNGQAG